MPRDDDYGWWRREAPAKTIKVEDGIKARSKRGAFATKWWAQRWLAVLEGFNLGARLQRGRTYARGGQVLGIDIAPGRVASRVQGSRRDPYRVTISVTAFKKDEKARLGAALAASPLHLAKLLAGEMPQDIESVLQQQGVSLFPARQSELQTDCSCPDWSNPCKHVAAVYYLLGEEFDRDPFLLFTLRGVAREELVGAAEVVAPPPAKPVAARSEDFWEGTRPALDLIGDLDPAARHALLERLGPFPFWRSAISLTDAVAPMLDAAAEAALSGPLAASREG
jgi:SWIM zinc finger